jgi:tetratricopeptide (TPR) repeat protein
LFERGRYRAAQRSASLAYRLLRDTTLNLDIGRTEMIFGVIALRTGDWNSAREYFESAIATYRRAGYEAGMASAYNSLGLLHKNQCRFKESARFLEQALRIAERAGLFHDSATYVHNLGIVHEKMGEWDLAEDHYRRALQMNTEVGNTAAKARALFCLGNLRRKRRDFASAESYIHQSLALAVERGFPRETILAREGLGDLYADRDLLREAKAEYETGLAMADQVAPDSDLTVELVRRLGDVELRLGEADAAMRHGERALAIARRLGDRIEEACSLRLIGLVNAEAGDLVVAQERLGEASRVLLAIGKRYELAKLNMCAGLAWRRRARKGKSRGVIDESVAFLRRAVAAYESLALPTLAARGLLELSRSELMRGLVDEAVIHVDHATSLLNPEDDPGLARDIEAFRTEIEQGLIEGTSSQTNEFSAFEETRNILRGGDAEVAVQEMLAATARRVSAARGCVAAPSPNGGVEVVASIGMSFRAGQELLTELERRIGAARLATAPVVTSRAGSDARFRDLAGPAQIHAKASVAILPLSLPSGLPGYLYLDRPDDGPLGAFKQREINLIAVLAN